MRRESQLGCLPSEMGSSPIRGAATNACEDYTVNATRGNLGFCRFNPCRRERKQSVVAKKTSLRTLVVATSTHRMLEEVYTMQRSRLSVRIRSPALYAGVAQRQSAKTTSSPLVGAFCLPSERQAENVGEIGFDSRAGSEPNASIGSTFHWEIKPYRSSLVGSNCPHRLDGSGPYPLKVVTGVQIPVGTLSHRLARQAAAGTTKTSSVENVLV